jgi:hypothetical protein
MTAYRFSPIKNDDDCNKALEYIDKKLRYLSELVLDEQLPIETLKIFAHYPEEYEFLRNWAESLGEPIEESSATSFYVKPRILMVVAGDPIMHVGIRVPDPYRSQVGCGDYIVKNLDEIKSKYLGKSQFVREVEHEKYQMLELFHPDIDVLGYIVKQH